MKLAPRTLLVPAFVLSVFAAGPALADCAADIEAVLKVANSVELSDTDKTKIQEITAAATEKQAAGDEDGCAAELMAAKPILKME